MTIDGTIAVTTKFESAEFNRLATVADSPADLVQDAPMDRIDLE